MSSWTSPRLVINGIILTLVVGVTSNLPSSLGNSTVIIYIALAIHHNEPIDPVIEIFDPVNGRDANDHKLLKWPPFLLLDCRNKHFSLCIISDVHVHCGHDLEFDDLVGTVMMLCDSS